MPRQTVLVSGAGVAGPTLAYWLARAGLEPTLVERSPSIRTGGYVIDFWGLGYEVADRMGIAGELDRLGYHIKEMRVVDGKGERVTSLGVGIFRELAGGRFVTIRRSDLAHLLVEKASPVAEIMLGDEIGALEPDADGVRVTFERAAPRRFDLVIGADGLHSRVRALAFGPQEQFERSLGYAVAAFECDGYRPREEDIYVMSNAPGCMLGRFALRDDRTLFLIVFTHGPSDRWPAQDLPAQKRLLRQRLGGGGEGARILDALDRSDDLYFDRVSQIVTPSWSRGRIALAGDAAFCVSLLAGQGSALAMTAAYALAGELAASGGAHREAFARYESLLRPFVETKQKAARNFGGAFAPKTALGLIVRNLVLRAASFPGVARLAFSRDITDRLALPQYAWP
ncbi:MAG: FAD-binding domain [Roseiarcus sp.]